MPDDRPGGDTYVGRILDTLSHEPELHAFAAEGRRITRGEALRIVLHLARNIIGSGARVGDGIALLAGNEPETVLIQLAVHLAGCRLILVPPELVHTELEGYLERADTHFLVIDAENAERVLHFVKTKSRVRLLSLGSAQPATDLLADSDSSPTNIPDRSVKNDDIVTLFYTGGTWGKPKIVKHSHLLYDSVAQDMPVNAPTRDSQERTLICTSVTHSSGHITSMMALGTGATVYLIGHFSAQAALRIMTSEPITSVVVNPPMLYDLLDCPDRPSAYSPTLKEIAYMGASMSPSKLQEAIDRFGPVLRQIYGMTETAGITVLEPGDHDPQRYETLTRCGKPMPGMEVQLRDGDSTVTQSGAVGEVVVRGRKIMGGYWDDIPLSRRLLVGGWFNTGDLGFWDDEGYLHLVGRARDVIVTGPGSDNVYCIILEEFLRTLPEVQDAAVIGIPDERYGEAIHVFIVPRPGRRLDGDSVRRQVVDELGELYMPRSISLLTQVPYTQVGKVDKRRLQELYADGLTYADRLL